MGNKVQVTSGDAKGEYGTGIGKHGDRLPGNV